MEQQPLSAGLVHGMPAQNCIQWIRTHIAQRPRATGFVKRAVVAPRSVESNSGEATSLAPYRGNGQAAAMVRCTPKARADEDRSAGYHGT